MTLPRFLAGLGVAVALGAGGGWMAGSSLHIDIPKKHQISQQPTTIVSSETLGVQGKGQLTLEDGFVRLLQPGQSWKRPAVIELSQPTDWALVADEKSRVFMKDRARVLWGINNSSIQVDRGIVHVHRATSMNVEVPSYNLSVRGTTFGLWVEHSFVQIAVLEGEADITRLGGEGASKHLAGQLVTILRGGADDESSKPEPQIAALSEVLEITLERKPGSRPSGVRLVAGTTSPGARVVAQTFFSKENHAFFADSEGNFRIEPDKRRWGKVWVRDVLGRVARPDEPALEDLNAVISRLKESHGSISSL